MGALVEACNTEISVKNTGHECDDSMGPAAAIGVVPPGLTWDDDDLADFDGFIEEQMHAAPSARIYMLFGNKAPIRTITVNDEDDVIQTFDDGSQIFIRAGFANRIYETEKGGLCYAAAMRSFIDSGKAFIEFDKEGRVLMKKNSDGTYSGFTAIMGGRTPKPASFTEKYMNRFGLSYDPTTYINQGKIFKGAAPNLDFMGLLDAEVVAGTSTQTTTNIFVGVKTECAGTDLVALLGNTLAQITNFVVKKVSDGSTVTISAAAVDTGQIKLTGTFTAGQSYTVELAAASTLYTNGMIGYEGQNKVTIAIPE